MKCPKTNLDTFYTTVYFEHTSIIIIKPNQDNNYKILFNRYYCN